MWVFFGLDQNKVGFGIGLCWVGQKECENGKDWRGYYFQVRWLVKDVLDGR